MTKWEYKWFELENELEIANKVGADGWECISIERIMNQKSYGLFKKPLQEIVKDDPECSCGAVAWGGPHKADCEIYK